MLAFAMMTIIRHRANAAPPTQKCPGPGIDPLVGPGFRRIATRLAQRRIDPAQIIAWSLWREPTKPSHSAPIASQNRKL